MQERRLTFGAKIGIGTAILAAVALLLAVVRLRALSPIHDSYRITTGVTARQLELAGVLNAAASDRAAGQRGTVLFAYTKNSAQAAAAASQFDESSARFRQALAELRPLASSDRARQLASSMEADPALWLPAYAEVRRLAEGGDADAAARARIEKTAHTTSPTEAPAGRGCEPFPLDENEYGFKGVI